MLGPSMIFAICMHLHICGTMLACARFDSLITFSVPVCTALAVLPEQVQVHKQVQSVYKDTGSL